MHAMRNMGVREDAVANAYSYVMSVYYAFCLMMQAEYSPYSDASSAHASALLRNQVKQRIAEVAKSNQSSSLPSSESPTTAAIAIHAPAGTSQQAFESLVEADAASLESTHISSEPVAEDQATDESQRAQTASQADGCEAGSSQPSSKGRRGDKAATRSGQLPTNLSMLQYAQQSEATRYHKKPKLESFDKIIGRPPNTPHHVSLQAAPTQKAYLPQWLASPLGMQASQHASSTTPGITKKDTGAASLPVSRFTTEDTELNYPPQRNLHRDMSLRVSPPPQRQRQLHQADPNEPLTPPQPLLRRGASVHSGPNPFATLSQSAFSPDRHMPPRPLLSRAASDTPVYKSNSGANLSSALAKIRSSSSSEQEQASTEGTFVSLHLQTVRPTAPKPYQTGQFGRSSPSPTGMTLPDMGKLSGTCLQRRA